MTAHDQFIDNLNTLIGLARSSGVQPFDYVQRYMIEQAIGINNGDQFKAFLIDCMVYGADIRITRDIDNNGNVFIDIEIYQNGELLR